MGRVPRRPTLRRTVQGALSGVVLIAFSTLLCSFERLAEALEFGVGVGAMTVAHLSVAVFNRQMVGALRELPWLRGLAWTEVEAELNTFQFCVGLGAATLLASFLCLDGSRALVFAAVVVPLTAAMGIVSVRRQRRSGAAEHPVGVRAIRRRASEPVPSGLPAAARLSQKR